jgi:hypothetical protein
MWSARRTPARPDSFFPRLDAPRAESGHAPTQAAHCGLSQSIVVPDALTLIGFTAGNVVAALNETYSHG